MIDTQKRQTKQQEKERVRRRMRAKVDPENYEYFPEKKAADYYDNDIAQLVAIYVRVSTDDVRQTTSYELQKKYYEDFVRKHPNWKLVGIYADEGISGTSLKHRDAFNQMIADCKEGKITLIITKSVSRFARNVMITIGMARDLALLRPPVGIFFESEAIFSLKDESQMALTFQATMAEEESHTRSRSMETSLRMRLDNGIPLTPKRIGYTHDKDGNLIINPEEAATVKLAYYMYLYGYSTQQIADTLTALERRSYLGNICWTSNSVVQILRNERNCGDVLTRKTYTEDFRTHRSVKNRGERPQSMYYNHHEAIVTRDDFIAVQRMLDNARYGNKSILPELRVIGSGVLRGFVSVNPRWAAFKDVDYMTASESVYSAEELNERIRVAPKFDPQIELRAGDYDLREFEVARAELFDNSPKAAITFFNKSVRVSSVCVERFGSQNYAELLCNPVEKKFAIRPATLENRNRIQISKPTESGFTSRPAPATAFFNVLFQLMDWNPSYRYRISGTLYEDENSFAFIFDTADSEAFLNSFLLPRAGNEHGESELKPLTSTRDKIRAVPQDLATCFGTPFYQHEQTIQSLSSQSEKEWKLRMEGQLFHTGKHLNVTPYAELQEYINRQIRGKMQEETGNVRT